MTDEEKRDKIESYVRARPWRDSADTRREIEEWARRHEEYEAQMDEALRRALGRYGG